MILRFLNIKKIIIKAGPSDEHQIIIALIPKTAEYKGKLSLKNAAVYLQLFPQIFFVPFKTVSFLLVPPVIQTVIHKGMFSGFRNVRRS